jgi:predicted transcriptional regulator
MGRILGPWVFSVAISPFIRRDVEADQIQKKKKKKKGRNRPVKVIFNCK